MPTNGQISGPANGTSGASASIEAQLAAMQAQLAAKDAEISQLRQRAPSSTGVNFVGKPLGVPNKQGEPGKGNVCAYNINRLPVSLYPDQWLKLLQPEAIKRCIEVNIALIDAHGASVEKGDIATIRAGFVALLGKQS